MTFPLWLLRARRGVQLAVCVGLGLLPWLYSKEITAIVGNFYALDVCGVFFADPLTIPQVALSGGWPGSKLCIGAGVVLGLALLQGRIFCGWFCPYGFVSELLFALRGKVAQEKHPLLAWGVRMGLTLCLLLGAWWTAEPLVNAISAPGLLSLVPLLLPLGAAAVLAAIAPVLLCLAVEAVVGQRFWCRYCCPQSLLLMVAAACGSWASGVRWKAGDCTCKGKTPCAAACSLGLQPRRRGGSDRALCVQCGDCVRACADCGKALRIGTMQDSARLP